jgi:hypothetical protein
VHQLVKNFHNYQDVMCVREKKIDDFVITFPKLLFFHINDISVVIILTYRTYFTIHIYDRGTLKK